MLTTALGRERRVIGSTFESGGLAAIAYGTRKPVGENTSGRLSGVVKGVFWRLHMAIGREVSYCRVILAIYPVYPVLQ